MSDYLSNDLIKEIFERLPAKSLLRFRSLTKSWCARIQSPDFISKHALRSMKKTPKTLIRHSTIFDREYIDMYTLHSEDRFVSSNPEWLDVSIPAVKFPAPMGDIVSSCNGILCLYDYSDNTISLWNPSIRRVTTLPPAPDHSNLPLLVGIGFNPSIDDYKIVKISQESSFVYTLKTGAWCPIASPATMFFSPSTLYQESRVCVFNGALHWVVKEYYNRYMLTFDLTTHVFGKIILPNPNWQTRQLTIINRCLAVIYVNIGEYQPPKGKDNRIWILKEYNNVPFWSDAYKFDRLEPDFTYLARGSKRVLQLTTNGHMLLYIGNRLPNFSEGDTYGVYNPETGKWDLSMIMHFQDSWHADMQTYVESLELLDTMLGQKKIDEIPSHNAIVLRRSEMPHYSY